jgi:hypothetical protein
MKYSISMLLFFVLATITAQNNFEPCSSILTNSPSSNKHLLKTAQQIQPEENENIIASVYTEPSLIFENSFLYIALNKDFEGFLVLKEFRHSHENPSTSKWLEPATL